MSSVRRVTLIPGDGVGPEVVEATRRVLEATGVELEWDVEDAGAELYARSGDPLPDRVSESVRQNGIAIKGPTSTPTGAGFRSVNLTLREQLGLVTGVRPCKAYPGVPTRFPGTDIVIVRMNQEDLYAGLEFARGGEGATALRALIAANIGVELGDDVGFSIKPLSVSGTMRVMRAAFEYARANGRSQVIAVHKASVMRQTDGIFLESARAVAQEYADIAFDDRLVDTLCQELVSRPERHDVLVLPVMYGDIVSDIGAGLIGGLGMAPGASFGDGCAVFEAVHGSAPRHRGQNRVNPMALMLSGVMLLRHVGERDAGDRLERAIAAVVTEGRSVTYDLKRDRHDPTAAGTSQVADAVIARLESAGSNR